MALTDKNILITPNIGAAADPKIVFSGADASTAAQNITLTIYPTNGGTLSFDGSTGQLFSVTNSMSGTIFSANDVSGIPSIEVLDTGLVKIAQYSGNVILGSGTDTGFAKLQVTGATTVAGLLTVSNGDNSYATFGPNTTWSSYLRIGAGSGGAWTASGRAAIYADNGNLKVDAGTGQTLYLNQHNGGGTVYIGGTTNYILHTGNYTSFAPTLTGGSASGTWGISVTGNAATVGGFTPTASNGVANRVVVADADGYIQNNYFYTSGGGSERNASGMGYFSGHNTSDYYIRSYTPAAAAAAMGALTTGNYTSYSPTLTGGSASGTWGISITGNAGNTSSIYNALGNGHTWTGINYFVSNKDTSADNPTLQAYSGNGSGAIMSFHRGGYYAINFGLDSDNVIRIGGWSAATNRLQMDMSGNLTMAGNVTAYSDERLKKDWESLSTDFVKKLALVKTGTFTRIDSDERQVGVSAQSLITLLPEAVQNDGEYLSVAYGNAALASAVELAKEVVSLNARIARLETLVSKLITG